MFASIQKTAAGYSKSSPKRKLEFGNGQSQSVPKSILTRFFQPKPHKPSSFGPTNMVQVNFWLEMSQFMKNAQPN